MNWGVRMCPYPPRRVPCHRRVVRDVLGDHAAGPDDASLANRDSGADDDPAAQPAVFADALANRDSGADDDPAAQPAVFADADAVAGFDGLSAFYVIKRMLRREQLDLGTNQHMVFNVDVGPVQEHAIEVDEDAFADMEVAAVIAIERRCYEASFT